MRVETTYYADDGTEFDTEEECIAYEKAADENFDAVQFFDRKRKLMEHPTMTDIEDFCYYVRILDKEKAEKLFAYLYQIISFVAPTDVSYETGDVLSFDEEYSDGWENLTLLCKQYNERLNEILAASQKGKR